MADKKFKIIAAVIIVIAVIGIAGIALQNKITAQEEPGNNKNTASVKEEVVTIKVKGYDGPGKLTRLGTFRIAEELGYLKGIKIEYLDVNNELVPAALVTGDLDAAHISYLESIRAVSKGIKVKNVALAHGAQGVSNSEAFVLADGPIKSAKDLKGKKVSGSKSGSAYLYLIDYLKKANLSINDIEFVTIPTGQGEQVLRGGQVDVVSFSSDYEKGALKERGGVRSLFSAYSILPNDTFHCGLLVSEKFIKEKPELLKKIVDGFVKAAEWERNNPEKAKELYAKWAVDDGIKGSELILKYHVPNDIRENALVKDRDVQWFIDRMVEIGELKEGQIKSSELYTNEFNPYFKK